jgi:hypothetical protein
VAKAGTVYGYVSGLLRAGGEQEEFDGFVLVARGRPKMSEFWSGRDGLVEARHLRADLAGIEGCFWNTRARTQTFPLGPAHADGRLAHKRGMGDRASKKRHPRN